MKYELLALALIGAIAAHPAPRATKREVPQEHSHENILRAVNEVLQQDNPDEIQDAVFGLLGAAAAAEGAGNIADAGKCLYRRCADDQSLISTDCLQQATADQAFTNAKAAGDVDGMTNALIYRALERNTGSVGLASVPCTSIEAVNPEIAALQQHQDPASDGAKELNKEIASELARQISAIGGDPALANEASTFEPGEIGDQTGAGNTCDDLDDAAGCINTLNLRVDDLSEDEIAAAVDGAGAGEAAADNNANADADADANAGDNNANADAGGDGGNNNANADAGGDAGNNDASADAEANTGNDNNAANSCNNANSSQADNESANANDTGSNNHQ
ncbi:hypothetical protein IAQ61_006902 [Plenodomus lingam]|uniref:Predicted protein n=1 Tax=Leptosphaeria maculans (strain JN3 / isolate v23.1.3 / race Av1-4-5-6-7-8) TaxID=985895 RepID=E5ACW5_LEPMJ|nr:predicted protein [Plenodomus lingam JN3]KAH9869690.1 hypothetical protein IAQ61_006902 [Plenodomus lingam]CBY02317.1 predicted protein [Plenodomus lingam JN3]